MEVFHYNGGIPSSSLTHNEQFDHLVAKSRGGKRKKIQSTYIFLNIHRPLFLNQL